MLVLFDWHCIIISYTRVPLFKVNVYSYWLYEIKRIFLIEWKTKIALRIKLRNLYILLNWYRIVLARSNMNIWISMKHVGSYSKPISS